MGQILHAYVGALRGVREVVIHNIPLELATPLKEKIMGNGPPDPPLNEMYYALAEYAGPSARCKRDLRMAQLGMESRNAAAFGTLRHKIMDAMRVRMVEREAFVYSQDPPDREEAEEGDQTTA